MSCFSETANEEPQISQMNADVRKGFYPRLSAPSAVHHPCFFFASRKFRELLFPDAAASELGDEGKEVKPTNDYVGLSPFVSL